MAPAALIKGYLPVRLKLPLPSWSDEHNDDTYFYVREHQAKASESKKSPKATLFVANAPVVPGVSTRVLLKSIFGRYAQVVRATVIENPRGQGGQNDSTANLAGSSQMQEPTFLPPAYSEGKFAHIVFQSPKDMKKALRALQDVMKQKNSDERPGLSLEGIEIQTLSDETNRQHREHQKQLLTQNKDGNDQEESDDEVEPTKRTGIHAVVQRYRDSRREFSREKLLEECNAVMQAYEEAEAEKVRAQELARSQPDEDGFTTVTYSTAVGSQVELEESATGTTSGRKGHKRSRKKKEPVGSKELQDFYRFQRRENKKRSLEELRAQFEEDLKRVKRMKEERHYKPF